MNLETLVSENRNLATMELDKLSTLAMLTCINDEDLKVPEAVRLVLPAIVQTVDLAARVLQAGGRLIYLGAGTSGRLGVLDAAECPPTFGVPPGMIIGLIAGGPGALLHAIEDAEDNMALGVEDLQAIQLTARDMVVGLAASGRTPYVIGALRFAREIGCATVAISCNPDSPITQEAQIAISPLVGPEALTRSTRMKSGTAQKLVLNMISTGTMVKLGKIYQNLMIDIKTSNEKLKDRACRIVVQVTGANYVDAEKTLFQTDFAVKPAILMLLKGINAKQAHENLQHHRGHLRAALEL